MEVPPIRAQGGSPVTQTKNRKQKNVLRISIVERVTILTPMGTGKLVAMRIECAGRFETPKLPLAGVCSVVFDTVGLCFRFSRRWNSFDEQKLFLTSYEVLYS